MALTPGTRLGPYEVTALIGEGGMGQVYRARDTKLNRDVALKVLPDAFASDPDRLARFTREAQTLAALNHPNIAALYHIGDAPNPQSPLPHPGSIQYLVMELVEGDDLAQRIARGALSLDQALPIARQITDALEAAHENGIVHRDLKPANIKLKVRGAPPARTEDGRLERRLSAADVADCTVKVLDFGLAKALGPAEAGPYDNGLSQAPTITTPAMMTGVGVILGTAAYMSPEQARGTSVDRRADLWAFGVVLWEMLTGTRLFEGATVSDTLASVLKTEPEWSALPPATPPAIRRLLRRCLKKDRRRRLDSAADARLEIEEATAGDIETQRTPVPARSGRREAVAWGLAGLAIAAAAGFAVWQASTRPAAAPVVASQFVVPPPENLVYRDVPAISPDGRTIAFVAAERDGRSRLWVRPLNGLAARALTGTEGAVRPFWSPDGRAIGFFARGELKKVDIAGGSPQVVARHPSIRNLSGSWGRDGFILFSAGFELMRVSATGGSVATLAHPGAAYPSFLPDGQHFLFRQGTGGTGQLGGIYVGALDSADTKLLVTADSTGVYATPGYLLFSRGGVLMAQPFDPVSLTTTGDAVSIADRVQDTFGASRQVVSVAGNGTLLYGWSTATDTRLEWMDRRGTPAALAADPGFYNNVALSPDGSRVSFDRTPDGGSAPDVWLLDLARHITSRFTFGPSVDNVSVWSPDGQTVAFASHNGKGLDIAHRPANASGPPQVLLKLDAPPIMFPSDWSSDGRFLAYYRTDPQTKLDLWVLPLSGDRKPMPLLHTEFNESQGQFSPDGKWMAYVSDESGDAQVYVQSFPMLTGKWRVSPDGGSQPRWRRDGKELFYLAADRTLMAVAVKPGAVFDYDAPRALFETTLPSDAPRQSYSVSADGQRFLLNSPVDSGSSSFTIVLNWTGLLKR